MYNTMYIQYVILYNNTMYKIVIRKYTNIATLMMLFGNT